MSLYDSQRLMCPICGEELAKVAETRFCLHCGQCARAAHRARLSLVPVTQWQVQEPSFAFVGDEGPYPIE